MLFVRLEYFILFDRGGFVTSFWVPVWEGLEVCKEVLLKLPIEVFWCKLLCFFIWTELGVSLLVPGLYFLSLIFPYEFVVNF